ncbi:aminotransferase class I/II-fold pyridoxal phosphate-dependent enzyme [Streptomyces sp. NPDC000410]|uniref:aminotransferase class I/II-fold pyridoxal phosphate-dependent enzyme n=1 Tax=Streptomyces sp. NPDC000410 TaxID=3154254 RepID=UPI00332ABE17
MLNENPLPPLASVAEEIARGAGSINRYPEFYPEHLQSVVAEWLGFPEEWVVVGSGSVGVALQALQAHVRPGNGLVYGWRNFDAYPLLADMTGARAVQVPLLPGGHQDLTGVAKEAAADADAVIVCNPHNPTGQLLSADELEEFIGLIPADTLIVLDEAYIEFVERSQRPDSLKWVRQYPNLLVLRTFSKAYGLAGMRVGYGVAHPEMAERINKFRLPYSMSSLSVVAVEASIREQRELEDRVRHIVAERERVVRGLTESGWSVLPSHTNFLWLDEPARVDQVGAALDRVGVRARLYPGDGVRLTIGERASNDAVLSALSSPR